MNTWGLTSWASWDRRSRLAGDATLAVVFVLVQTVWAVQIAQSWGDRYLGLDVGAGAAVCVLALLRRWAPTWTALGGLLWPG